MTQFKKNDLRCPVCLTEYNSVEMARAGIKSCPTCKTRIQPLLIENDGYIRINWQDMRVLAIYARRWSMTFDINLKGNRDAIQALENILSALAKYKPNRGEPIVPAVDIVMTGSMAQEFNMDQPMDMTPDPKTGLIPSPFYRRLGPPLF